MNKFTSSAAFILFALATTVYGAASTAGVSVTVKDGKTNKVVFQGATNSAGQFTTGKLEPGSYNVEFRAPKSANLKGQDLSISLAAGKTPAREASADGTHMQSGVALNIAVAKASSLAGKVSVKGKAQATNQTPEGYEKVQANVKVMNGKRYVWVPGSLGSNIGGKWVEEGTEGASIKTSNKKGGDAEVLRRLQDQSANVGTRPDGG